MLGPAAANLALYGLEDRCDKKRRWFPWAQLIYRAFGTQPDACPHCGERMGVQAFLLGGGRAEHVLQWVEAHGHRLRDGPYGTQAVAA